MNDLTPMLMILMLTNKSGFNSIKNAIEAVDGISSRISGMSQLMSVLPTLSSLMSTSGEAHRAADTEHSDTPAVSYIDTLKDLLK